MEITSIIAVVVGSAITGIITLVCNHQQHKHQLAKMRVERQSEFTLQETVKHYLAEKKFPERNFETLKRKLGGYDDADDKLRQLLLSVGAVRRYRDDKSEWWSLLERRTELGAHISNMRNNKRKVRKANNTAPNNRRTSKVQKA